MYDGCSCRFWGSLFVFFFPNPLLSIYLFIYLSIARRVSLNMLYKANWDPEVVEDPFRRRTVDLTAVGLVFEQPCRLLLLLLLLVRSYAVASFQSWPLLS